MHYVGIADCKGLDSFIPWTNLHSLAALNRDQSDNHTLSALMFRAMANRHRHAVIYRVALTKENGVKIDKLYNSGDYIKALKLMKRVATVIEIGKGPGVAKSWKMIPNPDLDPYGS